MVEYLNLFTESDKRLKRQSLSIATYSYKIN